jgi:hypothetical protein
MLLCMCVCVRARKGVFELARLAFAYVMHEIYERVGH